MPSLVAMWGVNNNFTSGGMRRETFEKAIAGGTKVVVVDPRKIDMASVADLWIRLRPSSDGVLAMGMLKVIVEETFMTSSSSTNGALALISSRTN